MANRGDVNLQISGSDEGLAATLQQATQRVSESVDQIKEKFASVGEGFESIKAGFVGLAAVMAGGELGEKLNEVAERAEQIRLSASNFNLSTTALQGLQAAAAQTGVESGALNTAMVTLQSRMAQAAEAGGSTAARFEALGITLQEMRDPSFSVIDALAKMGDASNSNAALMAVLGERGAELIPLMRELANNHDLVAESAQRVGALTDSEIDTLQAYKDSVAVADIAWQNFTARLLGEAAPALTYTTQALAGLVQPANQAANALSPLQAIIEDIGDALIGLRYSAQQVGVFLAANVASWGDNFKGLGAILDDLVHGHFAQVKTDWQAMNRAMDADQKEMFDSFQMNEQQAEDSWEKFEHAVSTPLAAAPEIKVPKVNPLADLSGHKSMAEQMDEQFQQLGEKLQATMARTQEQITANAASSVQTRESLEAAGIDRQIAGVQAAYRTGQITSQQELAETEQLLAQKWQQQQAYFAQLRTLYADNEQELARIDAEEQRAENTYLAQVQRAHETATSQAQKSWQALSSTIANDMTQAFSRVLEGTATLGQAMAQTFEQMGEKVIETLIKIEAQKAISHALGLTMDREEQHSSAAAAAAGAAKSAASIPYVGWILAPVAAASVYAMASGFSAEKGFDIPAGLNPKVQLHEREMVLPQKHADVIRGLAEGEGGAGAPHIHIHATDSDSFLSLLDRHDGVLREKIAAAVRGRAAWE